MQRQLQAFSAKAMDLLVAYHWPGNVRELQNAVEYAVNIETTSTIQPGSLPSGIVSQSASKMLRRPLADKLREYEKLLISEALESFKNSVEGKKIAAKELGISLPTLYRKLKEFNL